jgi:uncharacterized protein (TIGR03118 family)
MKKSRYLHHNSSRRQAVPFLSACMLISPTALFAQHYQQTNLLSDTAVEGTNPPDPNLKNPWGIARETTSPWWVSDNRTGVSTLYNGAGNKVPLTVTIPHTTLSAIGSPTGIVFNGSTTNFTIAPGEPAHFIFVSLDGTISAWNSGTNAVTKVHGSPNSVLTGATIAQVDDDHFLYVADLKEGKIKVYDANFTRVQTRSEAFEDDYIPNGFAPFNVQNIGGNLYVAYAQQRQ